VLLQLDWHTNKGAISGSGESSNHRAGQPLDKEARLSRLAASCLQLITLLPSYQCKHLEVAEQEQMG